MLRAALGVALVAVAFLSSTAFAQPRGAFVTSAQGTGLFAGWADAGGQTGLAAANQICQALATGAELPEPSAYRAWVSTSTTDAYCNVAGFSGTKASNCGQGVLPPAGPWAGPGGEPFAHTLVELAEGRVLYPLHLDEDGLEVPETELVWTGTTAAGVRSPAGFDCAGWTVQDSASFGLAGVVAAGTVDWTEAGEIFCSRSERLLCLQAGTTDPLPPLGDPGYWVFTTSLQGDGIFGTWADAAGQVGYAAATEICRAAARRGSMPAADDYRPWLSAAAEFDAIDGLGATGPWRREDGVRVAVDVADLTDGSLGGPIEMDEFGEHRTGHAWTGTGENGRSSGNDCAIWQAEGIAYGDFGQVNHAGGSWTDDGLSSCPGDHRLYCFSPILVLFADSFDLGGTREWSVVKP